MNEASSVDEVASQHNEKGDQQQSRRVRSVAISRWMVERQGSLQGLAGVTILYTQDQPDERLVPTGKSQNDLLFLILCYSMTYQPGFILISKRVRRSRTIPI